MGREIKRVPPNWEHPKYTEDDAPYSNRIGEYRPLLSGYDEALASFAKDIEEKGLAEAIEYHGGGPLRDDYVDFKGQEPTWFQVYETVSEGTPVTPPFETQGELIDYLVKNGDFWDQKRRNEGRTGGMPCGPWSQEAAENFVKERQWMSSMVIIDGKILTGSELAAFRPPQSQPNDAAVGKALTEEKE